MSDANPYAEADARENPVCTNCGKHPDELTEYSKVSTGSDLDPIEYVKQEEGTYNPNNGHFTCTDCYIRIGMPTAPGRGWITP